MTNNGVFRVAVVGVWHVHAKDYVGEALAREDVEVVGVWDQRRESARSFADAHGISPIAELQQILGDETIDALIVTTSTADHHDIITRALRAGKHVFCEKVLAATVDDARELYAEADRAGRLLFLSLQRLREPWFLASLDLIASGVLGRVTSSRIRYQHEGAIRGWLAPEFLSVAEAQGGAVIDLGAHGFYLSQLLHNAYPSAVSSTATRLAGHEVEDNSVVTLTYADDSLSVLETSLVSGPGGRFAEIFGTEGYIAVNALDDTVWLVRNNGEPPEQISSPAAGKTPLHDFFALIQNGAGDSATVDIDSATDSGGITSESVSFPDDIANRRASIRLTSLVSAAYQSQATGATQAVADPARP
jgi:1,5-anhydro-D-fructose reductase (1,5-anhydro-D-mannitol-forming)